MKEKVKWIQKVETVEGNCINLPEEAKILSTKTIFVAEYGDGGSIEGIDPYWHSLAISRSPRPFKRHYTKTEFTYVIPVKGDET